MKRLLIAAAILGIVTAACGGGGDDNPAMESPTNEAPTNQAPTKTVDIAMVDIAFQPTTLSVQRGERVEFVFRNDGKLPHDAFIGDTSAQADHEKKMSEGDKGSMGGHERKEGDGNAVTVESGKTERLVYTFDKTGTIEIGCHQPGHYTAGMKVAVTVA